MSRRPKVIKNPARRLLLAVRDRIRFAIGRLANRLGVPGFVADCEIRDRGNYIRVSRGVLFTVINVNGTDYYFYRWSGRYDGWGMAVICNSQLKEIGWSMPEEEE